MTLAVLSDARGCIKSPNIEEKRILEGLEDSREGCDVESVEP